MTNQVEDDATEATDVEDNQELGHLNAEEQGKIKALEDEFDLDNLANFDDGLDFDDDELNKLIEDEDFEIDDASQAIDENKEKSNMSNINQK